MCYATTRTDVPTQARGLAAQGPVVALAGGKTDAPMDGGGKTDAPLAGQVLSSGRIGRGGPDLGGSRGGRSGAENEDEQRVNEQRQRWG